MIIYAENPMEFTKLLSSYSSKIAGNELNIGNEVCFHSLPINS